MKHGARRHSTEGETRTRRRQRSERLGRLAELATAGYLLATGHRILGRRQRTPFGELDLIAVRGRRVAFVEVKWRAHADLAVHAVSPRQAARIAQAAEYWLWRQPTLRAHEIGLDCMTLTPWRLPRYSKNALQPG